MEWPDSTVITPAIFPDWWTVTRSGIWKNIRHFVISFLTIGSGDQLQVLAVVCHQPLDKVDLLESDLHCVLMLGPTG